MGAQAYGSPGFRIRARLDVIDATALAMPHCLSFRANAPSIPNGHRFMAALRLILGTGMETMQGKRKSLATNGKGTSLGILSTHL